MCVLLSVAVQVYIAVPRHDARAPGPVCADSDTAVKYVHVFTFFLSTCTAVTITFHGTRTHSPITHALSGESEVIAPAWRLALRLGRPHFHSHACGRAIVEAGCARPPATAHRVRRLFVGGRGR